MAYQQLGTEKYYFASLTQEIKDFRKQKNVQAVQAFKQFLFVMVVVSLTFVALKMMPQWLPVVSGFMDQNGVTETLRSLRF